MGCGCAFALVSSTMIPVTCSSGVTVPGLADFHRMITASHVFHVFRIWNGIGGWPLCPAMKALRDVKVGSPYCVVVSLRCFTPRELGEVGGGLPLLRPLGIRC